MQLELAGPHLVPPQATASSGTGDTDSGTKVTTTGSSGVDRPTGSDSGGDTDATTTTGTTGTTTTGMTDTADPGTTVDTNEGQTSAHASPDEHDSTDPI